MTKLKTTAFLAARIWLLSACLTNTGLFLYLVIFNPAIWYIIFPAGLGIFAGGIPVFFVLLILLPLIEKTADSWLAKIHLTILICATCAFLYGLGAATFFFCIKPTADYGSDSFKILMGISGVLFIAALVALYLSKKQLHHYFSKRSVLLLSNQSINMEQLNYAEENNSGNNSGRSNKILIKGAVTAALIGIMMIPTVFINDLVRERQSRQEAVVKEVSSRWSAAQTLTGPYIALPYKVTRTDASNKPVEATEWMFIIPDNLHVTGKVDHEVRLRSIYKVLLYHASLVNQGDIVVHIPRDLAPASIQWQDARVCFGISDFKGIEEKLVLHMNGTDTELSPGLPSNELDEKGLSAPLLLGPDDIGKTYAFHMNIKIKGSEMLHFTPLAGNSDFILESRWPNPSFDGNNLPSARTVTKDGFTAKWVFNKANLPFGTVLKNFKFDQTELAFGVTMVQPADQYAKTSRSVKYAILVIGLTFSLFFIIELMQDKPIHPVQYVLIGLGLVIFYSLLLSISEFLQFDLAYLISSVSTIVLIGLYAKSHFRNWRSAGIFTGVLTLLYGFIFVLIRLEDTALLVGSIGLFIILAITMYASKKVNWYTARSIKAAI